MAQSADPAATPTPALKSAQQCKDKAKRGATLKACPEIGEDWWRVRTYRSDTDRKRKWDDYWFTTYEGRTVRCRTPKEVRRVGGKLDDFRGPSNTQSSWEQFRRQLQQQELHKCPRRASYPDRPAKQARNQDGWDSDDEQGWSASEMADDDQLEEDSSQAFESGGEQEFENQQPPIDSDTSDYELTDGDGNVTPSDHDTDSLEDVSFETEGSETGKEDDHAEDTGYDGDYQSGQVEESDGDDDTGDLFGASLEEGEVEDLSGSEAEEAKVANSAYDAAVDQASSEGESEAEDEGWADPLGGKEDTEGDNRGEDDEVENDTDSPGPEGTPEENSAGNAGGGTKPPKLQPRDLPFLRRTSEPQPPPPDIHVSDKTRRLLQSAQAKEIRYNDHTTSLKKLCHFPLSDEKGGTDLLKCVVTPGSTVYHATEQSNKSAAIVGVSVTCSVLKVPHIVIMADKVDNVKANTEGKINSLLRQFSRSKRPIGAEFRRGEASQWLGNDFNAQFVTAAVSQGQATLVVPPTKSALQNLVEYCRRHKITNGVLTLDEADALLSTRVMRAAVEGEGVCLRTQREKFLYELLGCPPFQGAECIFRSVIWLSATHLATVWWHTCWDLPFRAVVANRHSLPDKGFSTEDDLKLARELDRKDLTAKNGYGIDSLPVRREFRVFRKDPRPGRLMFLVITPRVHAPGMNLFKIARCVLRKCVPDAVCIVIYGDNCYNMLFNDPENPKASSGQGIKMNTTIGVSKAQHGITYVDDQWGLEKPVVVLGYHCVGRAVSIRSQRRVITHVIASYQRGKNAADTRQMLMRGAGYTREVRQRNGFRHVRMACPKEDYLLVKRLHDFTAEVLKTAGTGDKLGLKQWRENDYPDRYRKILKLKRRHMQPGMQEDRPLAGQVPQGQDDVTSPNGVAVFHLRRPTTEDLGRPGSSAMAEHYTTDPVVQVVNDLPVTLEPDCILLGSERAELLTEAKYVSSTDPLLQDADVTAFVEAMQPGASISRKELRMRRKACQISLRRQLGSAGMLQGASGRRAMGDINCPFHHTQPQFRKVMIYLFTIHSDAAQNGAGYVRQRYTQEELEAKPSGWYAWHALTYNGKIEIRVKLHKKAAPSGI